MILYWKDTHVSRKCSIALCRLIINSSTRYEGKITISAGHYQGALPKARIGAFYKIEPSQRLAEVIAIDEDEVFLLPLSIFPACMWPVAKLSGGRVQDSCWGRTPWATG